MRPELLDSAPPLMTPREVARIFRVDPKTVVRWTKTRGLTRVVTLGGHVRLIEAEVLAMLDEAEGGAA
jgi:excisionase family DNA binding protein